MGFGVHPVLSRGALHDVDAGWGDVLDLEEPLLRGGGAADRDSGDAPLSRPFVRLVVACTL
jgi:hypothetical protein